MLKAEHTSIVKAIINRYLLLLRGDGYKYIAEDSDDLPELKLTNFGDFLDASSVSFAVFQFTVLR